MFLGEASMLWNFNSVILGFKQQYMPQLCSFGARVHMYIHCHLVRVSGIFYTPGLSLCFAHCLQVSQVKVCSSSDDHYWYFHGNHCICSTSGEYSFVNQNYVLASVVNFKKIIYFPQSNGVFDEEPHLADGSKKFNKGVYDLFSMMSGKQNINFVN